MAVIMRQALELAVDKDIIPENPFSKVKIDTKLFTPVKKSKEKCAVTERTKSCAGNRNVYLTSTAREILNQAKASNAENGYENSEYIFLSHGERVTARLLNTILRRCCRNAGISEKGMHKIRKTYISTLIDSEDININFIREQVGHTDERTTYGNYCFNRKSAVQTAQAMEKALAHTV